MGRLSVPDVPIEFGAVAHLPDWSGRGGQSISLAEDGEGRHPFTIKIAGATFGGHASYREEGGSVRAEWSMAPDRDVELACLVVSGTLPLSRFAGGTATLDGAEVALRREDAPAAGLFWGKVRAMSVRDAGGREAFSLAFPEPTQVLLQDNRRWGTPVYELRLLLGSGTFAAGERRLTPQGRRSSRRRGTAPMRPGDHRDRERPRIRPPGSRRRLHRGTPAR